MDLLVPLGYRPGEDDVFDAAFDRLGGERLYLNRVGAAPAAEAALEPGRQRG